MAFSTQDIETLKQAKAQGKTKEQALAMLAQTRTATQSQAQAQQSKPFVNRVTDFLGLGGATRTFGDVLARQGIGTDTPKEVVRANVPAPTAGQITGAALQTAAIPAGLALTGGSSLLGQAAIGAGLGYAYDVGADLIEKKSTGEVLTPGLGTVVGGAAPAVFRGASALVGAAKPVVQAASQAIPDSTTVQGVTQTVSDIADRVPRFIARQQENVAEQAARRTAIQTADSPAIANAIKVELPEKFINTVTQADEPTRQAYKRVVELAEEVPKTVGVKKNPTIVGGELAAKQYDIIENQRKTIGEAIGDATKKLSKTQPINMRQAYNQLDNILAEQGITTKTVSKGKTILDFSRSNLAPKQRQVVQDLYNLATEAGDTLSPYDIHKKDQLFSAIQREARADQVADIIIEFGDGQKTDLFRAFRDVYSNQLDTLGPEIKALNRKYRNVATLLDDIENSIFRTPNFEITRSTDPSEFAKVNLRRIFGESQSSPVYEAIADEMDTVARQLGYADASPKEVAAFAQELRELYPEITPRTGFQGGIRAGITDIAERVLSAGQVTEVDKREALKKLLEETSTSAN